MYPNVDYSCFSIRSVVLSGGGTMGCRLVSTERVGGGLQTSWALLRWEGEKRERAAASSPVRPVGSLGAL